MFAKTTIPPYLERYSVPCWLSEFISPSTYIVVCSTLWYLLLQDWIERIILLFGNPLFLSIGHTEGILNSVFFYHFEKSWNENYKNNWMNCQWERRCTTPPKGKTTNRKCKFSRFGYNNWMVLSNEWIYRLHRWYMYIQHV